MSGELFVLACVFTTAILWLLVRGVKDTFDPNGPTWGFFISLIQLLAFLVALGLFLADHLHMHLALGLK